MEATPQISVIVPNFNRENTILTAINSILSQSFQDFEIIIVDDHSTDNSIERLKTIKDERINIISLKTNVGAAEARNKGVLNSKAPFIALLDSDDTYEKKYLEKAYKTLKGTNNQIGFMWTGVRYLESGRSKEFCWVPLRKENSYATFLNSLHIGTNSGIMFKKVVFENCGYFNSSLPAAEDTEFFLRITKLYDYTYIKDVLINIDKNGKDRLSKNFKKIATAYNIFLPQHTSIIENNISLKKKFYYKMMWLNYHIPDKKKARRYFNMYPKNKFSEITKILAVFLLYEFLKPQKALWIHQRLSKEA